MEEEYILSTNTVLDKLELLEELGKIPEQLERKVRGQKDLDVLKRWHKFAASSEAFEEFEEKIAAM